MLPSCLQIAVTPYFNVKSNLSLIQIAEQSGLNLSFLKPLISSPLNLCPPVEKWVALLRVLCSHLTSGVSCMVYDSSSYCPDNNKAPNQLLTLKLLNEYSWGVF